MWSCKHCKEEFSFETTSEKANHSRWCAFNPKRNDIAGVKAATDEYYDRVHGLYTEFKVECGTCGDSVTIRERAKLFPKKRHYFCNRSCAASVGGRAKVKKMAETGEATYRTICFTYHDRRCIICGEEKILSVHHYDEDHHNNDPTNLVPMCPTHHQYWHSRYRDDIASEVHKYVAEFQAGTSFNGRT